MATVESPLLSIGAFARRTRLSPKALRLYDRLGLLAPDHVDEATGYRWYRDDQVERARLVALLRRLDMPLERIGRVLELQGERAAREVADYWAAVEARTARQRSLAAHLRDRLSGRRPRMYDINIREVGEQTVLTERRHLLADDLPMWISAALGRLEAAAAACGDTAGPAFVLYHAEVSEESDGPAEACVPVADRAAAEKYAAAHSREVSLRHEPAHRLAYTRLTKAQVVHPQITSAFDAVERWTSDEGLTVTGPCREVYFADWCAAGPEDEVCDVAFPVK
ncbi:MerR family transcriptional regulator [Streptomyces coffeae]|uniref:MerR family transcriptional regulator n=1 Tax=Streptomyces coffeae TaxID=621382 RepID=A0ABS1NMZ9_9ACTN|nr:MerR family transcriptional regulator [Streptomyces coffeae]MBL1101468.1 MerR family transcriptional regulator [Streptomyces coffeae]